MRFTKLMLAAACLIITLSSFEWTEVTPPGGEVSFVAAAKDGTLFIKNIDRNLYSTNQGESWEKLGIECTFKESVISFRKEMNEVIVYCSEKTKLQGQMDMSYSTEVFLYNNNTKIFDRIFLEQAFELGKIEQDSSVSKANIVVNPFEDKWYTTYYEIDFSILGNVFYGSRDEIDVPAIYDTDFQVFSVELENDNKRTRLVIDELGPKIVAIEEEGLHYIVAFGEAELQKISVGNQSKENLSQFDPELEVYEFIFIKEYKYIINTNKGIWKTVDGGQNWTQINDAKVSKLIEKDGVYLAINEEGKLVRSNNHCVSWNVIYNKYPVLDMDFYLDNGVVVGTTAGFAIREDLSKDWKSKVEGIKSNAPVIINCFSNDNLYSYSNGIAKVSSDKGLTWSRIENNPEYYKNIQEDNQGVWHALIDNKYTRSTNRGLNWDEEIVLLDKIDQMELDSKGNAYCRIDQKVYSPKGTFEVFDLGEANKFFVGTEDEVYRIIGNKTNAPVIEITSDYGNSWKQSKLPIPEGDTIAYYINREKTKLYSSSILDSNNRFMAWSEDKWTHQLDFQHEYVRDPEFPELYNRTNTLSNVKIIKDSIIYSYKYQINEHGGSYKRIGHTIKINNSNLGFNYYNSLALDNETYIYLGANGKVLRSNKTLVGVEEQAQIENNFSLTAFPNPIKSTLTINYSLPGSGRVTINIYNVLGELVSAVSLDEFQAKGWHEQTLNIQQLPAASYYLELNSNGGSQTILLIKE
jgi:type IX secretion system substrate protein